MTFLEGEGMGEASRRLQDAYVPTLIRNWFVNCIKVSSPSLLVEWYRGVFIPTQIINFAVVPHHLRFLVVSTVSLFWSK